MAHRFGALGLFMTTAAASDNRELLVSPDHPRTFWTAQFEKVDQYVQWNDADHVLEGTIDYGLPARTQWWDPVSYDFFKVRFPGVRLDAANQRLYVMVSRKHQLTLGHVESGPFGNRVVLEKDISFTARRHNGILHAALVTNPD